MRSVLARRRCPPVRDNTRKALETSLLVGGNVVLGLVVTPSMILVGAAGLTWLGVVYDDVKGNPESFNSGSGSPF